MSRCPCALVLLLGLLAGCGPTDQGTHDDPLVLNAGSRLACGSSRFCTVGPEGTSYYRFESRIAGLSISTTHIHEDPVVAICLGTDESALDVDSWDDEEACERGAVIDGSDSYSMDVSAESEDWFLRVDAGGGEGQWFDLDTSDWHYIYD